MGILSLYLKYYVHIVTLVHTLHLPFFLAQKNREAWSFSFYSRKSKGTPKYQGITKHHHTLGVSPAH